jgi:hypothetical protein
VILIPDISTYFAHKIVPDIDLEGVIVPGLTGCFFRRAQDGRTASAGRYSFQDKELFLSWGYADEPHCAWTTYRSLRGDWTSPHEGCPRVRAEAGRLLIDTGERVIALSTQRRPTRSGGMRPGRAPGTQAAGCLVSP